MLVEFSVANYKSIRDEAKLSLVADHGQEHLDTNVCVPKLRVDARPTPLVRSAVVYGANAAGKSNLLNALYAMKIMVMESARGLKELPTVPFRFDPSYASIPTTFEVVIVADGVRYQYGFAATEKTIDREWLYAWPRGRVQIWYERDTEHNDEYRFGDRLMGDKKVWRRATRSDALFLSTAIGLNSDQLRPVFDWFSNRLRVGSFGGWNLSYSFNRCEDEKKSDVLRFLRSADFAISNLTLTKEEFSPEMLPEDMPTAFRNQIKEDMEGVQIPKLRLTHETPAGSIAELDIEDESDGTQQIFALAGPWLDALEKGHVVVQDELHDKLHPKLVRFLVDCFHDPRANKACAQLLFSTHETAILSQDVFRRDQVWFCERSKNQATKLYPLNEFKPRKGVENLERAYLAGRYGALPFTSHSLSGEGEDQE